MSVSTVIFLEWHFILSNNARITCAKKGLHDLLLLFLTSVAGQMVRCSLPSWQPQWNKTSFNIYISCSNPSTYFLKCILPFTIFFPFCEEEYWWFYFFAFFVKNNTNEIMQQNKSSSSFVFSFLVLFCGGREAKLEMHTKDLNTKPPWDLLYKVNIWNL